MEGANLRMSGVRDDDGLPHYPPSYYEYELAGIVVHQGSADGGHYYSFIKERVPLDGSEPRWFEFNDTNVVPFDAARIPYECFGGVEEIPVYDREKGIMKKVKRAKINNAYILVYQRSQEFNPEKWEKEQQGLEEERKKKKLKLGDEGVNGSKEESGEESENEEDKFDENISEDSVSDPNMTPSNSSNSLVDIEKEDSPSCPASVISSPSDQTKPQDPSVAHGNEIPTEKVSSGSEAPAKPIDALSGGIMKNSPTFLALLFLGRLATLRQRRQREEEMIRRKEQKQRFLQGLSDSILPESVISQIWEDNRVFLVEKYVHDEDYLNFIWDITNLYSKTKQADNNGCNENELGPNMQTVQFATRFIMDIGSRTRTDSPMFDVWVNHIRRLYTNNLQACRWLLNMLCKDVDRLTGIFLNCSMDRVRRAFQLIITHAVACLVPTERPHYQKQAQLINSLIDKSDEEEDTRGKVLEKLSSEFPVIRFIETLLSLLKNVRRNMRNSAQYFYLLYDFALLGFEEKQYLLSRHTVREMIEFYLQQGAYSVAYGTRGRGIPQGSRRYTQSPTTSTASSNRAFASSLSGLVDLIAILSRQCNTDNEKDSTPPTQYEGEMLEMPKHDRELLLGKYFMPKLIRDHVHTIGTVDILKHWSWEHRNRSKAFLSAVKEGLTSKISHEQFWPYFKVFKHLLELDDSLQEWRINSTLVSLLKAINQSFQGKEAIGSCIRFIQKLSEKNERVKSWLAKNKAVANEILEHHQKLIQAEKEKEREQNAASSSRSLIPAHFLVKHK